MPCKGSVSSEEYADFIMRYFQTPSSLLAQLETECVDFVNDQYAIVHVPLSDVPPITLSYYTYSAIPKLYTPLDAAGLDSSGILRASRLPALSGGGQGVLIGFVDTGIDYTHPSFLTSSGATRILGIWDQTAPLREPEPEITFRPLYGAQYTEDEINSALLSETPLSVVPETDPSGHGTFLASVAAGNPDEENGFSGGAPKASIAMVKLKPAKQYLREFYLIKEDADAYQENDIMMGITYLYSLARRYSMPLVVCIGLGTSQGSHTGELPLDSFLNQVSQFPGSAVIVAGGNETGYGSHYRGVTTAGETTVDVELRIGEGNAGFSMELWAQDVAVYRMGFVSPSGELIEPLPTSTGDENAITFLLEGTEVKVYYNIIVSSIGSQVIFIRFKNPLPGIWHLLVTSAVDFNGIFHLWLPVQGFLSEHTYFLRPDPDTTITGPGNTRYPITVAAYNHRTGGIYIHSSRGFSRTEQVKPEIAAPGVDITGAGAGPAGFIRRTGTSVAAAQTAGAAALLLKWGILEGNDPYMATPTIKSLFIRGAKRNPGFLYPNKEFGYGTLDLYSAFLTLRL